MGLRNKIFGGRRGKRESFDDDLSWLHPPCESQSPADWDAYWKNQVTHGLGPEMFDLFCQDQPLIDVMREERMNTVLCVGIGISQEPRALSEAGFHVTAVDFSPLAIELGRTYPFIPPMVQAYFDLQSRRPGGQVDFVVGDILDPAVCPGPFDVVIERCTVQNFYEADRLRALETLADRLSPDGIFLSHCHDGGWRPPAEPRHVTEAWFLQHQWTMWCGLPPGKKPPGRVAWIFKSTG